MKVLVAPLDWGLGHATRCIPVIREFLRQGAEVEIAVVKSNARLLRSVFPGLRQRLAPSYNIVYPKHGYNMGLWLAKNGAHLNAVIRFEHRYVEEMVERHHYDVIVSDNRFGFYSRKAKSIYMTHQRRIAFPPALSAFESVGMMWHASVMRHFDEVWIPDIPEEPGYAGNMSHVKRCPKPERYVGALSRFENPAAETDCEKQQEIQDGNRYKFVAVVSGVEPARSRFEKRLAESFANIPGRHLIIQGRPAAGIKMWTEGNVDYCTHLQDDTFATSVRNAEYVVSRGGYSTVMDMAVLGASCIFVPTPGQYEQVILGRNLSQAKYAHVIDEKDLSVESLLSCSDSLKLPKVEKNNLLQNAVTQVLKK